MDGSFARPEVTEYNKGMVNFIENVFAVRNALVLLKEAYDELGSFFITLIDS